MGSSAKRRLGSLVSADREEQLGLRSEAFRPYRVWVSVKQHRGRSKSSLIQGFAPSGESLRSARAKGGLEVREVTSSASGQIEGCGGLVNKAVNPGRVDGI